MTIQVKAVRPGDLPPELKELLDGLLQADDGKDEEGGGPCPAKKQVEDIENRLQKLEKVVYRPVESFKPQEDNSVDAVKLLRWIAELQTTGEHSRDIDHISAVRTVLEWHDTIVKVCRDFIKAHGYDH